MVPEYLQFMYIKKTKQSFKCVPNSKFSKMGSPRPGPECLKEEEEEKFLQVSMYIRRTKRIHSDPEHRGLFQHVNLDAFLPNDQQFMASAAFRNRSLKFWLPCHQIAELELSSIRNLRLSYQ